MTLHLGDCLEVMAGMEPESVDAIVTDPPYGLEFMGKEWDKLAHLSRNPKNAANLKAERTAGGEFGDRIGVSYGTPTRIPRCLLCGKQKFNHPKSRCSCPDPRWDMEGWHHNYGMQAWHETWAEAAYRVAKPSAYLLAFGGTRTVHRMTVAIEDAGWIIRDMLVWAYASGFPKSKASLKPAWEPIVMARKPGPLRMLAIDECRLPTTQSERDWMEATAHPNGPTVGWGGNLGRNGHRTKPTFEAPAGGRWPANVILTDPIFDGGWEGVVGGGETTSGLMSAGTRREGIGYGGALGDTVANDTYGDSGTYSRFFLIPKADRTDREPVLGGLPLADVFRGHQPDNPKCLTCGRQRIGPLGAPPCDCDEPQWSVVGDKQRMNVHPTVKPIDLMRHLIRLVTPTGGVVLDPFAGSGSTLIAAEMEGFPWIGIEKEAEYVAIAEARLNGTQRGLGLPA